MVVVYEVVNEFGLLSGVLDTIVFDLIALSAGVVSALVASEQSPDSDGKEVRFGSAVALAIAVSVKDPSDAELGDAPVGHAVSDPNLLTRYFCISGGSLRNHSGFLLSRKSSQRMLGKAGRLVAAISRSDSGTPVRRTSPRETLN